MASSRQLKTKIRKTKKLLLKEKLFGVDPTGFAPVSPLAKGRILLHKIRARVHGLSIKQKKPSGKRTSFVSKWETRTLRILPMFKLYLKARTFVNTAERKQLRKGLREGALRHAKRDVQIAQEWNFLVDLSL